MGCGVKKAKTRDLLHREPAPTVEYLRGIVDRQMDHMRAYKTRQDDIVRGLGRVQTAIVAGSLEAAREAIAELMARDLAQAKDRQDNHSFALDIAIKTLERHDRSRDVADALSQIQLLVPQAFEKPTAGAAS